MVLSSGISRIAPDAYAMLHADYSGFDPYAWIAGVEAGQDHPHFTSLEKWLFAKDHQTVPTAAPRKKNGTLYAKRVTQIATLPVMEQDTSMYVFCAVAKGDADLLVEIRKMQTPTLEKAENDVLSQTDLFRA